MRINPGFMLIEVLAAVFIVGTMVSMVLPRFRNRATEATLANYVNQLHRIIQWTRQQAIVDRKTYRITFIKKESNEPDIVQIEYSMPHPEKKDQILWEILPSTAFETKQILPPNIRLIAALHNKENLFETEKNSASCYIMHEGLVQELILHITQKNESTTPNENATLILQPFLGTFIKKEGHLTIKQLENQHV